MEQPLHDALSTRPQIVLAIFTDESQAGRAVQTLRERGVPDQNISAIVRHEGPEVSAQEMITLDREADAIGTDVAVGSVVGGLAGFAAGLVLFSIPGLGQFLGLGVLASTLGGAALGSAAGERTAHLTALGLPEERAERYQTALGSGHVVVAVTADSPDQVQTARAVLEAEGGDEIDAHPLSEGTSPTSGHQSLPSEPTTPGKSSL